MFNLPVRKSETNVVLSVVLASMLLLSVSGSLPYSVAYLITITNYANAQTSSTVENASGIELLDTATNATTNTSMAQTIEENISSATQNKTELKYILPLLFDNIKQQTNQSNVTRANAAGGVSAAAGSSEVIADFNGDGFDDKAIGVPYEDIDSNNDGMDDIVNAGIVHVIYGSASGLSTTSPLPDQLWQQGQNGLDDVAEEGDLFGASLSSGDYNGDGFSDLAIGVPYEDINSIVNSGAVQVIYGSSGGLSTTAVLEDQMWRQDMPNIETHLENDDLFGYSLSSGDYNGDGKDDLAIGIPMEDFTAPVCSNEPNADCGMVQIIYGSSSGVRPTGSALPGHVIIQSMVGDSAEKFDWFGLSLASGDYNGDGKDDLAIGVPFENIGSIQDAGTVHIIYGSPSGLSATIVLHDQMWKQGQNGLDDVAEEEDKFGLSLASGDFNGDGKDDLAIGAPGESIAGETIHGVGKMHIIYGSASGLSTTSPLADQLWQQGQNGLDDVAEEYDLFGEALSSGDYNNDGKDDLAIGVPLEGVFQSSLPCGESGLGGCEGRVHIIYGSTSGLSTSSPLPDQLWQQGQNGLNDVAEGGDWFGSSLASGDYNGDGRDDLAIGAPGESIAGETIHGVGKMHIIYGSASGLSTTSPLADQLWQQGQNGLDDTAEKYDWFTSGP